MDWIEQIISRLSGCREWLTRAFIDPVAAGRFRGRLPDADMVRRSYDKTEGSKEIAATLRGVRLTFISRWGGWMLSFFI